MPKNHLTQCPCGSGQFPARCCLDPFGVHPMRHPDLTLKGPPRGYAHPRCYARALNDCSDKITKEHTIARSTMAAMGPRILVKGHSWLPEGQWAEVGQSSLVSKVLCGRHNAALSPLDAYGATFVDYGNRVWTHDELPDRAAVFAGGLIERWLLKMVAGSVASGHLDEPGWTREGRWAAPELWMRLLFEGHLWPHGWGIYTPQEPKTIDTFGNGEYLGTRQFSIRARALDADAVPTVMEFFIAGVRLVLAIGDPKHWRADVDVGRRRPHALQLARPDGDATIVFGWDGWLPRKGKSVRLRLSKGVMGAAGTPPLT